MRLNYWFIWEKTKDPMFYPPPNLLTPIYIVMETLLDALLNSWEHWGDLNEESQLMAQELGDSDSQTQDLQPHIFRLMQAWRDNDDNVRIDIQLNYHKSPSKYNLETLKFIKQFVQI